MRKVTGKDREKDRGKGKPGTRSNALADASNRLPTDLTGLQLGDYLIRQRLGQGGMAEVYLGEQQSLCRSVAIKVLKPHLAEDDSYVKRFHREAQAAASLVHANIVQIHEVNCIDGLHLIVQEYVAGENIKQILDRRKRLEPAVAILIIRQVAVALAKAHSQGLVHRDIKPENILVSIDAMVKVADFGLARLSSGHRAVELTEIGLAVGTPLYMSPEQVEGRDVDPRSDIYSLGVTLYHMLTGEPPFDGETPLSVALKHLRETPPPIDQVNPELPHEFNGLVERMLAKEPDDRFANVAELSTALLELPVAAAETDWIREIGVADEHSGVSLSSVRFAETQQLAMAIQGTRGVTPEGALKKWTWLAWLVAAAIGGLLASLVRPPNPLNTLVNAAPSEQSASSEEDATQQMLYLLANTNDDGEDLHKAELAWLRVVDFPPPPDDSHELGMYTFRVLSARKELARIYMQQQEYEEMLYQCQELSSVDASEREFLAFGIAGEAIAYFFLEESFLTLDALTRFTPALRGKLEQDDPEMMELLGDIATWTYAAEFPAMELGE